MRCSNVLEVQSIAAVDVHKQAGVHGGRVFQTDITRSIQGPRPQPEVKEQMVFINLTIKQSLVPLGD